MATLFGRLFYPTGKTRLVNGDIDWVNDTIKCALFYAYDLVDINDDEFLSDILDDIDTLLLNETTITNKTIENGLARADDCICTPVSDDPLKRGVQTLVLYKDTGDPATSPLLLYMDEVPVTLPLYVPLDTDVYVTWSYLQGLNQVVFEVPETVDDEDAYIPPPRVFLLNGSCITVATEWYHLGDICWEMQEDNFIYGPCPPNETCVKIEPEAPFFEKIPRPEEFGPKATSFTWSFPGVCYPDPCSEE